MMLFEIVIGLSALVFFLALIRYVIQLINNNARLHAITLRGYELELELTRAQIDQAMNQAKQDIPVSQTMWNGYRRFQLVFKEEEVKDITSFYLAPVDGKVLPRYLPGQHLIFKLNIPEQPKPVMRCYSLSDSPNHPDYYRVTIKKQSPPKNMQNVPPGLSSSFFHDSLIEGDILDVKAPSGHFHLDMSQNSSIVLIAGGVGITPILSMLNAITEKNSSGKASNRETYFFLGCRNQQDHVMKEYIERIAAAHDNVSLQVCYSDPTENDILGKDYHHEGRVTTKLLKNYLPSNDFEFYFCGPPKMMENLHKGLSNWEVPDNKIHYEAFNSEAVSKMMAAESTETESSLEVTFSRSKMTLPWNPSTGTLLNFAEENGVMLESGCRAGNCGTCKIRIERGLVTYLVEPGEKPDARSCLPCITVPKTDLTLDG